MKKVSSITFSVVLLAVFALAQEPKTHIALTGAEMKWGPGAA